MNINIRAIKSTDAEQAGKIVYEAFANVSTSHGFPPDFPSVEIASGFVNLWIQHPDVVGFAAELDGKFVGSNFVTEFDEIRGVGPITVEPATQASGIGRALMKAVIERGRDASGIRLVQAAFNTRSMSLYASLGFDIKEPLALMAGKPTREVSRGTDVRPMTANDLDECEALYERIHGISRRGEVSLCLEHFRPFVAVREGRIVAYSSAPMVWALNHGVAETEIDLLDVLAGASRQSDQAISLLLPTRQADVHRRCLASGLRMVMPLSLMTMGKYQEPISCYFPSVLY